MARKSPYKRKYAYYDEYKKSRLTPVIVITAVVLLLLVAAMTFFTYRFLTNEPPKPRPAPSSVTRPPITSEPPQTTPAPVTTALPETTKPPEMTKASTTPPTVEAHDEPDDSLVTPPPVATAAYDREFFAQDLFVGDSLSAGLLDFGMLSPNNLFTKIGLNPVNIKTSDIGGVSVYDKAKNLQPKRIFIMLGTNGMDYLSAEVMTANMATLVDDLKAQSPDSTIVIMTVPPITKQYEETNDKGYSMDKINAYNSQLKDFADENDYILIDTSAILMDGDGYLAVGYAERDGMHLLIAAYKAMLSYIQESLASESSDF